jgi:DNA-binding NtrC family response regulator
MPRVLVVDDDLTVCDAIQAGLEEYCGATVICRSTGVAAIEVMRDQRLDAIITDADLPDINGFELAERAANLNIPILLAPGHPDAMALCQQYSYPHLAKPFLPSDLAEKAIQIIRAAAENIAQVRASTMKLVATAADLDEAIKQARRTIAKNFSVAERIVRGDGSPN